MFIKIKCKPLSVNECWQGRRFKTDKYKAYETELLYRLPKIKINSSSKIILTIKVGFSNNQSDLDNICKPFQDILQKKYNFNDSRIYELHMFKEIVKKGNEFIEFKLIEIKQNSLYL